MEDVDMQAMVRQAVQKFAGDDPPDYQTLLVEERLRREQLEQRLNELVAENRQEKI